MRTGGPNGGMALKFVAANSQYIDCGNNTVFTFGGNFSLCAWVNGISFDAGGAQVISKDNNTVEDHLI